MQNNSVININSLSYITNNKKIISDISFKVDKKDYVSIIGPNGSGKSTLIKLIAGNLIPTSGEIYLYKKALNEWNILDLASVRAILPQFNNLSFPFTVLDVIKMGRFPFEHKKDEGEIYERLLNVFDLKDNCNQIYTTLSGGEKQRVQLARVFAQIWTKGSYENKVLIMDEPTSFLDIKHELLLFDFIEELNKQGLTIIMVVHNISKALIVSNKIAILKASKLIAYGFTDKIINNEVLKSVFGVNFNLNILSQKSVYM